MSSTAARGGHAGQRAGAAGVAANLEAIVIPVSDVDRARDFYGRLGWRLDADRSAGESVRFVQFTPPGSGCAIQFGANLTSATPGSAEGLCLAVADIEAAREDLVLRGIEVSEVFHEGAASARFHPEADTPLVGVAPDRGRDSSYVAFGDPDGNAWLFHEVGSRFPRRVDPGLTTFASAGELASALRRVEAAHGEHEMRTGQPDSNWPDWYAAYMVAEQAGAELPT